MSTERFAICEFCDTVHRRAALSGRAAARCRCCGGVLYRSRRSEPAVMLALALAALVVLLIANAYPLMKLTVGGSSSEATLWQIIAATLDSNVAPIALVAAATVLLFPLFQVCLYLYVLVPLLRGRVPRFFVAAMHLLRQMQPWSMVEVFVLGLLVAVVKLGGMATAGAGIGMWAFAVLTLLLTALNAHELEQLWQRAEDNERAAGGDAQQLRPASSEDTAATATAAAPSPMPRLPRAAGLGLIGCPTCGLVLRSQSQGHAGYCPRCDQALHRRKPNGIARCWALLIAAAILYVPANALPVLHTHTLFEDQNNTILSGVVELWNNGAWDLAVIVFTASIAVPLVKLACLTVLLLGGNAPRWRRERTRIYRMVEFIGRWSMLDVFVVALLLSLVQFGKIAEVHAGGGIVAFCAVVVLTMLASMSYDPRGIWDRSAPSSTRRGGA
jgi:paraquat-inducible protein A